MPCFGRFCPLQDAYASPWSCVRCRLEFAMKIKDMVSSKSGDGPAPGGGKMVFSGRRNERTRQRLAEALRENLRRRKTQQREQKRQQDLQQAESTTAKSGPSGSISSQPLLPSE